MIEAKPFGRAQNLPRARNGKEYADIVPVHGVLCLSVILQRFQLILNRWNRCNYLFLRISERKSGSHFCWKCFNLSMTLSENRYALFGILLHRTIENAQRIRFSAPCNCEFAEPGWISRWQF